MKPIAFLVFWVWFTIPVSAQEKGSRAEYKAKVKSQSYATEVKQTRDEDRAKQAASALSDNDKRLLGVAVDKMNKVAHKTKYSAVSRIDKAEVGTVVCIRPFTLGGKNYEPSATVTDVVDDSNAIAVVRPKQSPAKVFWLRGFDVKNNVNGDEIKLDGFYAITGTKAYDSDRGKEKILVLEPVDVGNR